MDSVFRKAGFLPLVLIVFFNSSIFFLHELLIKKAISLSFLDSEILWLDLAIFALINLPFMLFFWLGAFFTDAKNKIKLIRIMAFLLFLASVITATSYILGLFWFGFFMIFVFSSTLSFYLPLKFAIIKPIVGAKNLTTANAILIITIIFGFFLGLFVSNTFGQNTADLKSFVYSVWPLGVLMIVFSLLGLFFSFRLKELSAQLEPCKFCFKETNQEIKQLFHTKNIFLSVLALGIFAGSLAMLLLGVYKSSGDLSLFRLTLNLLVGLVFGVALVGVLSKNYIERATIPIGVIGMSLSVLAMSFAPYDFILAFFYFSFGIFGGLFITPLFAIVQFFSTDKNIGKALAFLNFSQSIFSLVFVAIGFVFLQLDLGFRAIFVLVFGIVLLAGVYSFRQLPHLFARFLLLPALKLGYKINIEGIENLPQSGAALLIGNHISWIDWLILQVASPREIRFVMFRDVYEKWYLRWFFNFFHVIPVSSFGKSAIKAVRKHLQNGELVALFPEGHISFNGQIGKFERGFELAIKDLGLNIVPFYLRGLWGSTFSMAQKHFKELSLRAGKREIIVSFGQQLSGDTTADVLRQRVVELSFSAWENFLQGQKPLQYQWLQRAKENAFHLCIADSTGKELSHLRFMVSVFIASKRLKLLLANQTNVALMLPSSVAGAITNVSLFCLGKVAINLNYTSSAKTIRQNITKAGVKNVVTSRAFLEILEKRGFNFKDELKNEAIFLEDLLETVSKKEKTLHLLSALFLPTFILEFLYCKKSSINDTAIILFSSGSEGQPKGVELTHKNLLANIKQVMDLLNFSKDDVMINSLPIFHSFGLTVTMLLPLCEGVSLISLADPTDSANLGKLTAKYKGSILFGTSTFFRLYIKSKKLSPLMLKSVRIAIAGAEKLNMNVKKEFKVKFGIDIFEGYGTTETTPVVAVNMPNALDSTNLSELFFNKDGSVGLPLPGTIIKIIDPNTNQELPAGEDGLIIIGGSQVMRGYYDDESLSQKATITIDNVRYYKSGDKGHIDKDGFLSIVDRYSRFAKIAGEMISLSSLEEEIKQVIDPEIDFMCVALSDDKKGEKIVLLHTSTELDIKTLINKSKILPIAHPHTYFTVDEIPKLGSGKSDFYTAKVLAESLANKILKI